MKSYSRTTSLSMVVLFCATVLPAAEPLPFGHKDFVPTPERPIYFRAGNGEYPGATPPLGWREGTVARIKVAGIYGNPPQYRTNEVIGFSDTQSSNMVWKAPLPGWSLSHPIVVGNPSAGSGQGKVFAVGEPDFVACWDLETGKPLWQRRIMPLLLDGLPEERAVAGQKVLDLARALMFVGTRWPVVGGQPDNLFNSGFNKQGELAAKDPEAFLTGKRAMAGKLVKMVESFRPDVVAFGDDALIKALDADLGILKRYENVADIAALKSLLGEKAPGRHDPLRPVNLVGACTSQLGVDLGGSWWGYVGSADSTLASDGQRIYGVFDQGQVFALDLDGKLLWGHREKAGHDNRGSFHRSPLVCGDLVLVRSYTEVKGTGKLVRAFESGTGKLRWEAPLETSNYTIPRLVKLSGQDLLVGDAPTKTGGLQVLRVGDGSQIGELPKHNCGRGAVMSVCGDVVTWTSASDTGGGPSCSYRLKLEGPDKVTAEQLFVLEDRKDRIFHNQHNFPTLCGTAWLYGDKFFDVVTGKQVGKLPAGVRPDCAVMAGRYLIGLNDETGPYGRKRDDRMALVRFSVVDVADLAQPKLVSDQNYLGYTDPPADIIVRTYFKDFDPYSFAGCYLGTASYVTEHMGGPVPHGNKLLVQTSAYLYCLGGN